MHASVQAAVTAATDSTEPRSSPSHFVIGLAPDGGRLAPEDRAEIRTALEWGLNVDSGLHDFLTDDRELTRIALRNRLRIRDVRKPPGRSELHFFSGKIEQVDCLKVAVLGTDSAVGKRTTAWMLVDALVREGRDAELIGTGQTAWMQGARFSLILDSLVNDFVAGEIEHAVWRAWQEASPDVIVIEGQGSLMNPAYPGGHEILAAARPDVVVMQHAPARIEYDGFPGYPLHPLSLQIDAVQLLSGKPVVAIAINDECMTDEQMQTAMDVTSKETGLPTCAPLKTGVDPIVQALVQHIDAARRGNNRHTPTRDSGALQPS
jgi:uncharacterized NAD-dependent epimerase/dehydratase family protein